MAHIVGLQGRPGSGKTMMACKTAVRKPVYCHDIDNKLNALPWAQPLIRAERLFVTELEAKLDEEQLTERVKQLASNTKLAKEPQGWREFADHWNKITTNEKAMQAGTWLIDSGTQLGEHIRTHLMFHAGRNKYQFDQWSAYKMIWCDVMDIVRKKALKYDKDVIWTFHERDKEVPGDRTTGAKFEKVGPLGNETLQKVYQGVLDLEIYASIDGSFGGMLGTYFTEYYWLYVKGTDDEDKMPEYVCRVLPDGKRSLRTSFPVKKPVHKSDFAEIWK